MQILPIMHTEDLNKTVRRILGKVELYDSNSTLISTYKYNDALKSFTIERVGDESKFFGYGVSQKLNVKLRDVNREINITTDNYFKVRVTSISDVDSLYALLGTNFYVTEVHRDENTNELSITAYDLLYEASKKFVSELNMTSYTIEAFANACANLIGCDGMQIAGIPDTDTCFDTN